MSNQAMECRNISELMKFGINSHLRKAMLLSLIYFPEFKDSVGNLQNSYIEYYTVLVTSFNRHVNETVGTQAASHNRQAFIDTSDKLTSSRNEIDLLFEKFAQKYAKA